MMQQLNLSDLRPEQSSYTALYVDQNVTIHERNAPQRSEQWLDGLRGLAALGVFAQHLTNGTFFDPTPYISIWRVPFIRNLYMSAPTCVAIFFVASGYGLSLRSLRAIRNQTQDAVLPIVSSSLLRRPIRLYLPMLGSCFIYFLATLIGLPLTEIQSRIVSFVTEMDALTTLFDFRYSWEDYHSSFNNPTWTIPIEMLSSLFVYLALILLSRVSRYRHRTIGLVLFSIYCLTHRNWQLACFFFGILLADRSLEKQARKHQTSFEQSLAMTVFNTLLLTSSAFVCGTLHDEVSSFGYAQLEYFTPVRWGYDTARWYGTISGIACVWAVHELPRVKSMLVHPWILFYGTLSYSIYLVHWTVLMFLTFPMRDFLLPRLGSMVLTYLICLILSYLVVVQTAKIFDRYIDKPSIRLSKWIEQKVFSHS